MLRHFARSDERQLVPLSAASFLSGFLDRPKISRGNISTATRIYSCVTKPEQDFNSSENRNLDM